MNIPCRVAAKYHYPDLYIKPVVIETVKLKQKSTTSGLEPAECFHCGAKLGKHVIVSNDRSFCCNGCKQAYRLLHDNELCTYYELNEQPGQRPEETGVDARFAFLDDSEIQQQLIEFTDGTISKATFKVQGMHCSSCIWLLEKLYRFDPGINSSQVDFLKKTVAITFTNEKTNLRHIAELLSSLGYEPDINIADTKGEARNHSRRQLLLRLGVSGFALGNIMLLSFPEYLSNQDRIEPQLLHFFGILNLLLALPVLLISARGYFSSAYKGLRQRIINIDVPIALGILALFLRSTYEILHQTGTGYMDSFAGLVFLLLLGKYFQEKTFDTLSFERDYRSYFPIFVTIKKEDEETIPLAKLQVGDRIVVRNGELVPADAVLLYDATHIDYSFVTGESNPVIREPGDIIYAGGRQVGGAIELDVVKDVSQSYLTQLWNREDAGKIPRARITSLTDNVGKYFTAIVLLVATMAGGYWLLHDPLLAGNAFTAVLIIACPCALALSAPFALGTIMRIMGRNQFFLKNTQVIESMAYIDHIIFDKTGTLTKSGIHNVTFSSLGSSSPELSSEEGSLARSLARHSNHPLSRQIYQSLDFPIISNIQDYNEQVGTGISGMINGNLIQLGTGEFIGIDDPDMRQTVVYLGINGQPRGMFVFENIYRDSLRAVLGRLKSDYGLGLLTGDNDWERNRLQTFFNREDLFFRQTPFDKLAHIQHLQSDGSQIMMMGDGLNDAGALQQSNVGVAVSENRNMFSPACDGILDAQHFHLLPLFLRLSRAGIRIIIASFIISFIYNIVGLSFAVTGRLSPLISAILMPISSISVILFATTATYIAARHLDLWSPSVSQLNDTGQG